MMTKEEVKRYIGLHGDARKVIDTIKEMQAEGIEVTEQALDERLTGFVESEIDEILSTEHVTPKKKSFNLKAVLIAVGAGVVLAAIVFIVGVIL